jgi:hypothetical protein
MAVPIAPAAAPMLAPDKVRCSVLLILEQPVITIVAAVIAIIFFISSIPKV